MSNIVVVVEDEFLVARDIKNVLNEEGYDVIVDINDYYTATNTIEEVKPAMVILDINLKKDKDGVDLGKYLLLKDKVPFIYLTASTDKQTLDRVSDTRPYGFLVKPFRPIDLKTTVSVVMNNFRHRNIDVVRHDKQISNDIPFVIKSVINYINENIYEKIEISDLVSLTRWNSQHFTRMFNKCMGITPYQYVLEKKIQKAKILLSESDLPITQISYELGFKSHSNFCQNFKKIGKQTPENYRTMHSIHKFM